MSFVRSGYMYEAGAVSRAGNNSQYWSTTRYPGPYHMRHYLYFNPVNTTIADHNPAIRGFALKPHLFFACLHDIAISFTLCDISLEYQ